MSNHLERSSPTRLRTASVPPPRNHYHSRIFFAAGVGLLVLVGASLIYVYWQPLYGYALRLYDLLQNKDEIKAWIKSFGPLAPAAFIIIQSLQVVFAPIPGEMTGFLGGYLFGVVPGFTYSTIGLTLGSIAAFLLGRWLEIHFVEKVVSRQALDKFDFLMKREGLLIAFLLFLMPGFPKDYLCFILGLSHIPLRLFAALVFIGRIPGTLLLSLQGASVFAGNYRSFFIMLIIFFVLGGMTLFYREKFYQWLRNFNGGSQS